MNSSRLLCAGLVLVGALSFARPQGGPAPAQTNVVEVPVGGIILWWGRAEDIPEGFEACDGTIVTTRGAVLSGAKPNLQSKFPRGATNYRSFVPKAYSGGGRDEIQLSLSIEDHVLTKDQLPAHAHRIGPLSHRVSVGGKLQGNSLAHSHDLTLRAGTGSGGSMPAFDSNNQTFDAVTVTTDDFDGSILDHPETTTTTEGRPGAIHLQHKVNFSGLPSSKLDLRPAYVDVVFLIRVK